MTLPPDAAEHERVIREALRFGSVNLPDGSAHAALTALCALVEERTREWEELVVQEHDSFQKRRAAEARAERYEKALRELQESVTAMDYEEGSRLDQISEKLEAALAEQPPAENTDFEWKAQDERST